MFGPPEYRDTINKVEKRSIVGGKPGTGGIDGQLMEQRSEYRAFFGALESTLISMLSPPTLALLEELQARSHAAYPEGGLLYTYIEAANQAHVRYSTIDGKVLPEVGLRELACFLQSSQGDYVAEAATPSFVSLAQQLLARLNADLNFEEISWSMEDGGHDMSGRLKMARRTDNRFFGLELMWSVD